MSENRPEVHTRLRDLDLPPGFDSSDNLLESFYVPALSRAINYDRSVGYFRSSIRGIFDEPPLLSGDEVGRLAQAAADTGPTKCQGMLVTESD